VTIVFFSTDRKNGERTRKRILVVEDDWSQREGMRRLLESAGFAVRTAEDASTALRLVRDERFDLMLADLGLPGMTGLELIAQLPENSRPRVVVVTGDDTPESLLKALHEKACEYVTKPFNPGLLLKVIRDTLELPDCADQIEVISADPHWVEFCFPCDIRVADHIQDLLRKLESDLPTDVRDSVGTAFYELVRNAVEWGGHLDPKSKVRVTFQRTKKLLLYRIADPGPGFDPAGCKHAAINNAPGDPTAHVPVRESKGMRPGGFGIMMAQALVDEMIYNEAHNEVLFLKYLH
jgi:CheY-like chemotaxis protein